MIELDIPATVKRISQDGFFLAPVYRSCRAKKIEVVLLIDQSNSMLPFDDICDRLVTSLSQLTSGSNFNKSKNLTPQPPSLQGKGGKEKIFLPRGEKEKEILPPSPRRGEVKSEILPPSPRRGGAGGGVKNKPNLPLSPKIPVYYFRNSPQPSLYTTAKLIPTHKQKLAQLLPKFNPNHTSILIFSDGGAARGGLNPHRIELTADFLAQVKPFVQQIVWLNPVPKSRWESTTASYIADDVPMFDFTPSGWRNLLRCLREPPKSPLLKGTWSEEPPKSPLLRGTWNEEPPKSPLLRGTWNEEPPKSPLIRGTKPLNLDKFVVGTSVPENNLFPSTSVLTTNFRSGNDNQLKYQIAARKINSFAAKGEGYLEFAYHAAFPLALTTDLLYYLRQNFQPDIPWYGEVIKQETKKVRYYIDILPGNILLEMMVIPGGTFLMGSPSGEGDNDEHPQHEVTISPFYMAKYPITQAQWRAVAEGLPKVDLDLDPNPAYFKNDDKLVADTFSRHNQ